MSSLAGKVLKEVGGSCEMGFAVDEENEVAEGKITLVGDADASVISDMIVDEGEVMLELVVVVIDGHPLIDALPVSQADLHAGQSGLKTSSLPSPQSGSPIPSHLYFAKMHLLLSAL